MKLATHVFTHQLLHTSSCRPCQTKRIVVFIPPEDWRQNRGLNAGQHTTAEDEGLPANNHLEDRTRTVISDLFFLVLLP